MIQEGMTVARLNMAHGELEDHVTRKCSPGRRIKHVCPDHDGH